jgi:membrane protease YdiL (CAAX protease family)
MDIDVRKKLTQFFVIAFAFSWLIWLPGILLPTLPIPGKALEVLGALGPAVAALYLTYRAEGKIGLKRVIASSFGKRCKWSFTIWAGLMLLGVHAIVRLVYGQVTDNLPSSEMLSSPLDLVLLFIIMFFLGGGLNEEIGWRGYALDLLQGRYTALGASLMLGVFWILWHLPVFFLPGTNQSLIPFWLFSTTVLPLGVMMTWVYNNSNKSIFAVAIFHTIGNLAHELFYIMPTKDNPSLTGFVILTVLYYLAAIAIVAIFGVKNLSR